MFISCFFLSTNVHHTIEAVLRIFNCSFANNPIGQKPHAVRFKQLDCETFLIIAHKYILLHRNLWTDQMDSIVSHIQKQNRKAHSRSWVIYIYTYYKYHIHSYPICKDCYMSLFQPPETTINDGWRKFLEVEARFVDAFNLIAINEAHEILTSQRTWWEWLISKGFDKSESF